MQIQNGHITITANVGKRTYNATFEILGGGLVEVESGGRTLDIGQMSVTTLDAIERVFKRKMAPTRAIIREALFAWAKSCPSPEAADACDSLLIALAHPYGPAGCHPGLVRMKVKGYPFGGIFGHTAGYTNRIRRPCVATGAAACSNGGPSSSATGDGIAGKVVDLREYVRLIERRAKREIEPAPL